MPGQSDRPLQRDLARAMRRRGVFGEVQSAWIVSVANGIAKGRYSATVFRNGDLVLVSGSLPAAELQLAKEEIRAAINKKIGSEIVRTIRVKQ